MTVRDRLWLAVGIVVLPLALSPLILRPSLAIGVTIGLAALALAARSIVYPVALAGLPAIAIGLTGASPPAGVVAEGIALWIVLGIALLVVRADNELPAAVIFSPAVAACLLLAVWMLVRLNGSLDPSYGSRKLQLFVAQNVVALVAGILVGRRANRTQLWVGISLLIALLGAAVLMRGLVIGHAESLVGGRFSLTAKDSPISLGRAAARGILLAIYVLLLARRSSLRVLALAGIPLLGVAFAASGSRGPVLGLLAGLAVLLGLSVRDAAVRRRVLLVVASVSLAAAVVPQVVPAQIAGRTFSILSGSAAGTSSNGRAQLWGAAWSAFGNHPAIGIGTGSFHAIGGGVEYYPHNLFLETAAELGFVGLALLLLFLGATMLQLRAVLARARGVDRQHAALIGALLAAAGVNALFSGDITDNDAVWLAAGLSIGLGSRTVGVLSIPDPRVVFKRPWRRSPGLPEAPGPVVADQALDRGQILSPVGGSAVISPIQFEIRPARTGKPVHRVMVEALDEEGWSAVAEADERTYELELGDGAAIVRSSRLAELLGHTLGVVPTPSRRRPWTASRVGLTWTPARAGSWTLRAVTCDAAGAEVPTDQLELEVTFAEPPAPEPPSDLRAPQVPDSLRQPNVNGTGTGGTS